jgi:hypothetical protein
MVKTAKSLTFTPASQVLHKMEYRFKALTYNNLYTFLHSFTSFTQQEQEGV